MKVIKGGYQKGYWLHDRNAYSDEEIAIVNERFRQLIQRYPQYRSFFEFFLWDIQPKPELKVVK
jgi:hypothetical protein